MSVVYLDCCNKYQDTDFDNEVVYFHDKTGFGVCRCIEHAYEYLTEEYGIEDERALEEITLKGLVDKKDIERIVEKYQTKEQDHG